MHPQSTNIYRTVHDTHGRAFETAGVLELFNEYSGSDAEASLL
jgi:hypothetical protein